MSLWDIKEKFDELFWFNLFNIRESIRFKLNRTSNVSFPISQQNDWCIVLNGPSSLTIPPEQLEWDNTIFVNFGFRRPEFKASTKPLLLIVDDNFMNNTWPADMLRCAQAINNNCRFVLNYKFSKYVEAYYPDLVSENLIRYIANTKIPTSYSIRRHKRNNPNGFGVGVGEQSIAFALQNGAQNIHIHGLDCNNVVLGLSEKKTHIYGVDENKVWTDPITNARELRFQSFMINRLLHLSHYCQNNEINLYNYSDSLLSQGIGLNAHNCK